MTAYNYRPGSGWNDKTELQCLQIMKRLAETSPPRGIRIQLCREMAKTCPLSSGSISAKIGNYKSLAGLTNPTNASDASEYFWEKYGHLTASEIQKVIDRL